VYLLFMFLDYPFWGLSIVLVVYYFNAAA